MISRQRWLHLLALFIASPALAQSTPAASGSLPPAEDFYKPAAYSDVTLSPNGRMLAALVPFHGHTNLALVDLDKKTSTALTDQLTDDVIEYRWLGNRIIELKTAALDQTGGVTTLNAHVLVDVVDARIIRDMRKIARFRYAVVLEPVDPDGDQLIIETLDRADTVDPDVRAVDAYLFDVRSGAKKLLTFESPGHVLGFVTDHRGQVRVAISSPPGSQRSMVWYRATNDDKWTLLRDEPENESTFEPVSFDFDDRTLYVHVPDEAHGGRAAIHAYDTQTGQLGPILYEPTGSDAGSMVADWVQHKAVGVRDGSADGIHWLDPKWQQIQVAIDQVLPNARNRLVWARDNTDRILVSTQTPASAPTFYLFDRKALTLERVARSRPWLNEADLSPRVFVRYQARDGLTIPGFLTMPKHSDGAKPPLIVDIHGGPFVHAEGFGYDADSQFFASRGYAVFQPDFRGTVGYGTAFAKAGWRQWGGTMQDDVTDGVKWLIDSGKVDGDRVCLFGASYGGYATLWGLEKEPTMFRCGIAFLAVSDLELMFDANWSDFMRNERSGDVTKSLAQVLGDPVKDREKLRDVSPVNHADRIQAPLLLAYGATDQRVPLIHGNEMRSALDKAHKEYEWVVYNDQQHLVFDPVNGADFYRRVEAFLAKNMKPRSDAAGPAASPSSPAISRLP